MPHPRKNSRTQSRSISVISAPISSFHGDEDEHDQANPFANQERSFCPISEISQPSTLPPLSTTASSPLPALHDPLASFPHDYSISHLSTLTKHAFPPTPSTETPPTPLPLYTPRPPSSDLKWQPPKPSLRLLYKYCSSRDYILLVIPATILSIGAGILTPLMTLIIGSSFNAFATYPLDIWLATDQQKHDLKAKIAMGSFKLIGMGVGFVALNSIMAGLWVMVGERIARRLRNEVFTKIGTREMSWFDLGMGAGDGGDEKVEGKQEGTGAAGLMAKFTRETDEVRIATSQNIGLIIGDFTSIIACLILAMIKSWLLTLVILSAVPLVVLGQGIVQHVSFPLLSSERRIFAAASTKAERATSSIATVKAFNAEKKETEDFFSVIEEGRRVTASIIYAWGTNIGFAAFVLNAMFVAGFWFGSKMVREGKIKPGDVITVFFSTVLASSSLQSVMPMMETIQKGMGAMVSLQVLINPPPPPPSKVGLGKKHASVYSNPADPSERRPSSTLSPLMASPSYSVMASARPIPGRKHRPIANLAQIRPAKCQGEIILRHVSFAYPSRPKALTLSDISIFLPSGEMTFIVGGSGSGKSTIAQLLLQLYRPSSGTITIDDQEISVLDSGWMKEHIASVQQGCVLFDMTVHENVSIGLAGSKTRRPEDASREEVVEACRRALIHDFILELPEGYDTKLGTSGASLSGGQKQRMAIARAVLRDPPVLILDEATSALDPTSRILVFEAIRAWRKNRTTIVITHDLSQIAEDHFVYVIKHGSVVEEGFRADLARSGKVFGEMVQEQQDEPLALKDEDRWDDGEDVLDVFAATEPEPTFNGFNIAGVRPISTIPRHSYRHSGYFDILSSYTNDHRFTQRLTLNSSALDLGTPTEESVKQSVYLDPSDKPFSNRHRKTILGTPSASPLPSPVPSPPNSAAFAPSSWGGLLEPVDKPYVGECDMPELLQGESVTNLQRQGEMATLGRTGLLYPGSRIDRQRPRVPSGADALVDPDASLQHIDIPPNVVRVILRCMRSSPYKPLLTIGFIASLGHGAITPVWSNYLSDLMSLVAQGGGDPSKLRIRSLIVLGLSLADGLCVGLSMIALDITSNQWACDLRDRCFRQIMAQEKAWFDRTENSPSALGQCLIKDADDMLAIISDIPGKFLTAVVMIGMGIIWAACIGWKLTLIGVAVIPVFMVAVGVQFKLLNSIEMRNKRTREEIAKVFYETVSNVRAVRAMALESIFTEKFDIALALAYRTGLKGAWIQGIGNGLMNGLVYFVEALLFYVIAVLMAEGSYTYATALRVFSLVVFSLTFGSQMLSFLPTVAKAKRAALDFQSLIARSEGPTPENAGDLRPKITGQISFSDVHFAYASRPELEVLSGVTFDVQPGECIAIVGGSGSGKSTIAALLQRLYEPTSGSIHLDRHLLASADTRWLREHVSVVSQVPALFDMTVTDNVAYGTNNLPFSEVKRACKAAQVHDFILTLPQGYDTVLGENASLISGGQAQRLQIARALVKRADILILDECTSALDPANQAAVLETIMRVRMDRTVFMVTHKLPAMQMCSRILVVSGGTIVEDGSFEELVARRGVFAELARGGEWK